MTTLNLDQAKEIADVYFVRREAFHQETPLTSLLVVLLNYGDHLTQVHCISGEWTGKKGELQPRDGIPLCPNGHPLIESHKQLRLGLVEETV